LERNSIQNIRNRLAGFFLQSFNTSVFQSLCINHAQLKKYFKRYYLFTEEKLISLHNFRKMILDLNLVGFGEKESNVVFNQSVGLQVEEIDNHRLMHLNYLEFLECLGRISEKICLTPLHEEDKDWALEKKKNLNLHLKFESLMYLLYEKCSHRSF
jgi:hypothetical protein